MTDGTTQEAYRGGTHGRLSRGRSGVSEGGASQWGGAASVSGGLPPGHGDRCLPHRAGDREPRGHAAGGVEGWRVERGVDGRRGPGRAHTRGARPGGSVWRSARPGARRRPRGSPGSPARRRAPGTPAKGRQRVRRAAGPLAASSARGPLRPSGVRRRRGPPARWPARSRSKGKSSATNAKRSRHASSPPSAIGCAGCEWACPARSADRGPTGRG